MKTREFLLRYAGVYCYALSICLLLASVVGTAVQTVSSRQALEQAPVILIDAGHGGIDGGATSCTGILEQTYNLEIARKLEALLQFLGRETVMTRSGDDSVATEGTTIRQKKRSDLRNRVNLIRRFPNGTLVSIHQNQFPDARYAGPQVFYATTDGSRELAQRMQAELNRLLAPSSRRLSKQASGIYLMNHVSCPAVLVECGFLSNPREEALLRNKGYQQKLCGILAQVLLETEGSPGTDS